MKIANLFLKAKIIFKVVITNFGILLLLISFGELSLRILKPNMQLYRRAMPELNEDKQIIRSKVEWPKADKDLGWVCKQFDHIIFTNQNLNKLNTLYNINKEGFRNNHDFSHFKKGSNNIMMLGDSFLFGVYLNNEMTIPFNLSKILNNENVINLGIPGYGVDQMFLTYKKFQTKINHSTVVLLYIDDDIIRTYASFRRPENMSKPSFEIVNGELKIKKINKNNFVEKIFQNSFLLNKFYQRYAEYKSIELTKSIIIELNKLILQNKKKRFIVFRCPDGEQIKNKGDYSRFSLAKFFSKNDIEFYDIEDFFINVDKDSIYKFFLPNDGHLSGIGTEFISNKIGKILLKTKDYNSKINY